ncbi:MAG TPA: PAS domain S-box protein [Geobacteraceae bacterium]
MARTLRLLIAAADAGPVSRIVKALEGDDYAPTWKRVGSATELASALETGKWELVIACAGETPVAVKILLKVMAMAGSVPFIVVTEEDDDELASRLLRAGASDVVAATRLRRLGPVIARELDVAFRGREWYRAVGELRAAVSAATAEKEKAETVISTMSVGISIQDHDYRILYQNDAHKGFTGDHRGELCYRAYEGRESVCAGCPVAMSFADGANHWSERVVTRDGMERCFDISSSPLRNDSGTVISCIELVQDITARKRVERSLKESERRFRETLENIQLAAVCLDIDGNITFCNDFLLTLTGWHRDEVIGRNLFTTFLAADDFVGEIFQEALHSGAFPRHYEAAIVTRYKEPHLISWNNTVLRDHLGAINGVACIGEDITSRRQAEAQLREKLHFIQVLIDTIPTPIFYKDRKGVHLGCNRAFEEHIGLSREQIVGRTIFDLVPPDLAAVYHEGDQALLDGKEGHVFETSIACSDGTRQNLIFYEAAFKDASGMVGGTVGAILDITARKEAEAKLHYLASHDILTGLYNRAYFDEEMERLKNGRKFPVSIVVADVDGLKDVNDTYGHASGDELLKRTATALREAFRGEDVVARIGGDEFCALLPQADKRSAAKVLKRVQGIIDRHNEASPASPPLSLSLGLSTARNANELSAGWREADANMYKAKLKTRGASRGRSPLPQKE